ncbi:hypothetical protein J6590_032298 [Homalodisca vitripennis]|nr:hypothetical protein J6590_032298 [Homalodisca vitripennis]
MGYFLVLYVQVTNNECAADRALLTLTYWKHGRNGRVPDGSSIQAHRLTAHYRLMYSAGDYTRPWHILTLSPSPHTHSTLLPPAPSLRRVV